MLMLFLCFAGNATAQKGKLPRPGRIGATAAPTFRIIAGNPLTIHVGSDTSFQVFNAAVPGQGQIFPTNCTSVADMGVFANVGGVLYSPNFDEHVCGSATAGLGVYTDWTEISLSAVSGSGTAASPFSVTAVVDAGATGIRMTMNVTYVNGDNFFRVNKTFTATTATTFRVFEGADIFLAASDAGVPYLEPSSQSPGGRDCGMPPTYTILLIPITPATAYSARQFGTVWSEIRAAQLSNVVGATCVDNGAANQWNQTLAAGGSTTIQSAVSFGAIPTIATFRVDAVNPNQGMQGQALTVTITGVGFQAGTTFTFGPGITVNTTTINSSTQATVQLTISLAATPGFRDVTGTQSPGGLTSTLVNGFQVLPVAAPPLSAIPTLSFLGFALLLAAVAVAGMFVVGRHLN